MKAANAGGDKTTVAEVAGKMTVTYPIPGVAGAMATATLDAKNMAERVEGEGRQYRYGVHLCELRRLQQPAEQDRRVLRGKIVEKRNGVTVRDLTTTETETGNLYVVMPVPPSVKKAASPQSN